MKLKYNILLMIVLGCLNINTLYAQLDNDGKVGPDGIDFTNHKAKITWGGQVAKIQENWGIELHGDATRPVQVRNTSLMIGFDQQNSTDKGEGNLYVEGTIFTDQPITSPGTSHGSWGIGTDRTSNNTQLGLVSSNNLDVNFQNLDGDFKLATSNVGGVFTTRMRINNDGRTGIGTENLHDQAKLTVDGHVYIGSTESEANHTWDDETAIDPERYDLDYLLWVEKGIVSNDFALADPTDWSDFVFEEGYDMLSLEEVEEHIEENGYLHTMPSAKEVTEKGYSLHDMNKRMVQTIEELTLHTIEQEKQIESQHDLIKELMTRLEALEASSN